MTDGTNESNAGWSAGGRVPACGWVAAQSRSTANADVALALEVAAVAGVEATATRLQLGGERLRDWMRTWDLCERPRLAPTPFVELPRWSPGLSSGECLLELESPTGRKLRISLKGTATAQALALSELLWRSPS